MFGICSEFAIISMGDAIERLPVSDQHVSTVTSEKQLWLPRRLALVASTSGQGALSPTTPATPSYTRVVVGPNAPET